MRKFNLKLLCRRYSDGGATPPAEPAAAQSPEPAPVADPVKQEPAKPEPEKSYTKAEVDTAVNDAVSAALAKYKQEQENAKDYDKMTPEQKVAFLEAERKDRALQDFTAKHLEEQKIPPQFAAFLKGTDEDNTKARAAEFKAVYDKAVQDGVDERFKQGGYNPKVSGTSTQATTPANSLKSAIAEAINV